MEPERPEVRLVVAHPEREAREALVRLVRSTRSAASAVADRDALLAAVGEDTIAIVDLAIASAIPEVRELPARASIAVLGPVSGDVAALVAAGWRHVLAQPTPALADELFTTVQKLRRDDVFGLEKYVGWGAEVRSYTLEDAGERDAAVRALTEDLVEHGQPERVGASARVIADALIANALYVAPVDAQGRRTRLHEPRGRARGLRGRDVVTLRWATHGHRVALEVRDRWGSLDPAAARLAAASTGGSGLARVHACCDQLVLDLEPGVMTEAIAVLDGERALETGRPASFHLFVTGAPDGWGSGPDSASARALSTTTS